MKTIPHYHFHKTKYGEELLIDIVELNAIRKYIEKDPSHTLSYFDITFIKEGTGFFSVNEEQYTLQPYDVVFTMSGEVRTWDPENLPNGYALIFEEEFLLSFFNDPLFIEHLSYFKPNRSIAGINITDIYQQIDYLLSQIITEINNYEVKDNHILRARLYEILMLLNRQYNTINTQKEEQSKFRNSYVRNFIRMVNEDFKTYHTTQHYADQLCITPNYLNEVVKKAMGFNAKLYINNKLIAEAKRLLTYSSLSIAEITEDLNYESSSYFIRQFRDQTGFTPLQYRNKVKR